MADDFMPAVRINVIPHRAQRYDTCGDWLYEGAEPTRKKLMITVSDSGDWRTDAAIAIHELCEALICRATGVTQESVDTYDEDFEAMRKVAISMSKYVETLVHGTYVRTFKFRGMDCELDFDPGDHPDAPYYEAHQTATIIERIFCLAVKRNWVKHNRLLDSLDYDAS